MPVVRGIVAVLAAAAAAGVVRGGGVPGPGPPVLPPPGHHADGRAAAAAAAARGRGAVARGVLAAQPHALALDLGAVVLEPQLDVLGLQLGELLPVLGRVEGLRVLVDHVGRRVRVLQEPLLQLRDLSQRVDEDPRAPLARLRGAVGGGGGERRMMRMRRRRRRRVGGRLDGDRTAAGRGLRVAGPGGRRGAVAVAVAVAVEVR